MLKKVILVDAVITLLLLIVSVLFFKTYAAAAVIGIIVSAVNFLLNALITNYTMKIKGSAILIVLGALVRVVIAGAFALILYRGDILNIVAYLVGYSLHYMSIIIGTAVRRKK